MADRYETMRSGFESPAIDAFSVTPNDGTDLVEVARALFVGGAGDVTLVTKGGSEVTFSGVGGGALLPVRTVRVKATGTTATNIIGLV